MFTLFQLLDQGLRLLFKRGDPRFLARPRDVDVDDRMDQSPRRGEDGVILMRGVRPVCERDRRGRDVDRLRGRARDGQEEDGGEDSDHESIL
jgi:hypothetical protein